MNEFEIYPLMFEVLGSLFKLIYSIYSRDLINLIYLISHILQLINITMGIFNVEVQT